MNKKNNIILVGMPGGGKTYYGIKLAQKLDNFTFVDTDDLIEKRLDMSIREMFEKFGEEAFRREESYVIKELLKESSNKIIAVGGGAFNSRNIEILKQHGVVFYLKASINLIYERVKNSSSRPLLMDTDDVKSKLVKLLNEREKYYEQANYTIEQDKYNTEDLLNLITQKFYALKDCIDILSYPVFVNSDDLSTLKENILANVTGKYITVIDENVEKLYGKELDLNPKFVLKHGEKQKNIKNYVKIIDFASQNKLERGDTIVAIGGGVVGDISGFAAATYLRGIHVIHVPTTLLACVDSSIGGKTGINSDYGKNLIGAFYQPDAVFCNLNFLKTLDDKQFKTGLAEVLKYAFIENTCKASTQYNLFEILEHNVEKVMNREFDVIKDIIKICIELKETVVKKDEKESKLRQILNFGHTLGHALEKTSNYKLTHGEAVAQGMVFAFEQALNKRIIGKSYFDDSMKLLKSYKIYTHPPKLDKKIIDVMKYDKKVKDGKINFVLPFYPKAVEIVKVEPEKLL